MKLKKFLTILFAIYAFVMITLLVVNSQLLYIEDHEFWINMVVVSMIFILVFYLLSLVVISGFQSKVNKQEKLINDLKGKLYDSIKDDEARDKMMKDFEKSIKQ
jgi:hypothetical protein